MNISVKILATTRTIKTTKTTKTTKINNQTIKQSNNQTNISKFREIYIRFMDHLFPHYFTLQYKHYFYFLFKLLLLVVVVE